MVKGGFVNPVWVCETDILSPAIISVAVSVGIVNLEGRNYPENFDYTHDELCMLLEKFFGFQGGFYEVEILPLQKPRFSKEVVENKRRFFGTERSDKDWVKIELVEAGLCSREMYEMVTYGEIVNA